MSRNADSPQAPVPVPVADQKTVRDPSVEPRAEVSAEHDTTLKWIVSDHMQAGGLTPPPVKEGPARERTPPSLPPPPKRTTPPPTSDVARVAVSTEPVQAPNPPAITAPEDQPTPPPTLIPANGKAVPSGTTAVAVADSSEPKGATPSEFALMDSTPEGPIAAPVAEGLGAAPVTVLPGTAGSDSELSADAVELLPSAAEDGSAAPAQPTARETNDTPREGIATDTAPAPPEPPAPAEPREVEPDAVEMVESAEQPVHPEPALVAKKEHAPTPPPVRPDAGAVTPPPVPAEVAAAHAIPTPHPAASTAALFEENQTPAAGGEHLPEALARRSLQKRSKPWYEEVFDEDYLRTLPFMTREQTEREVSFLRAALSPPKGGDILDVGCGYGRHALELAQDGFRLTGLDLSLPLLIRAADDAQRRGLTVNFVHTDMREMSFNGQFDGAYCLLSSFGYFDEETNLRVASSICRALKPGGRFLLDIINRDYIVKDLPSRVWWEGEGCVVLEEVDFNYHTSRVLVRRSVVFGNGRQSEQEISLRAYSLHEVGKLLRQAGLRILEVSGSLATKSRFFGAASRNIIALCERPAS
jgi:SAM-dependent methyltransferase